MYYMWVLGHLNIKGHWRPFEMIFDDYDGQWYPGMDGAKVFSTFVLWLRKNPGKNLNRKTDLTGDRIRAR